MFTETNADNSSRMGELGEKSTELFELDEENNEMLEEGFQHGKAVLESGDRVEAEPFAVQNDGKETDNQEGNEVHICSVLFLFEQISVLFP